MEKSPRNNWLTIYIASAMLLSSIILFSCPSATADWTATVTSEPSIAYQTVPFDYSVTINNVGDAYINVITVNLTIIWPGTPPPGFTDPSEHYIIFDGYRQIAPGEVATFSQRINSHFYGGFQTRINITAWTEGSDYSTQTFYGSITMQNAPDEGLRAFGYGVLVVFFFIFFGIMWLGFLWGKFYWSHEIDNAFSVRDPDALLWWKWHPYYWERNGKMWYNYVLWLIAAAVLIILIAIAAGFF